MDTCNSEEYHRVLLLADAQGLRVVIANSFVCREELWFDKRLEEWGNECEHLDAFQVMQIRFIPECV